MSGLITAVVGVGAAGAAYQGRQARKTAKGVAESSERVATTQAEAQLEIAADAEALNRERYAEAQGLLMPRVAMEDAAQRQLFAEMGIPLPPTQEQQATSDSIATWESLVKEYDQRIANATTPEDKQREMANQAHIQGQIDRARATQAQSPVYSPMMGGFDYQPITMGTGGDYDAYLDQSGYGRAMDEALSAAEQSATIGGATTYGGRRLKAAGEVGAGLQQSYFENYMGRKQAQDMFNKQTQQSYFNNYMNILQNLAEPQVTQNLSSLGVGQGATIGSQNIAAGQDASNYMLAGTNAANQARMQGTAAQNAAIGDVLGGGANILSGMYMGGYI